VIDNFNYEIFFSNFFLISSNSNSNFQSVKSFVPLTVLRFLHVSSL
jgi:hypothetical protein